MRCSPSAAHQPMRPCRQLWPSRSHSRPNERSQARVRPNPSPATNHQFTLRCATCRCLATSEAAEELRVESSGGVSFRTRYFSSPPEVYRPASCARVRISLSRRLISDGNLVGPISALHAQPTLYSHREPPLPQAQSKSHEFQNRSKNGGRDKKRIVTKEVFQLRLHEPKALILGAAEIIPDPGFP